MARPTRPAELDELVAAVLGSPKYRDLLPALVREVGARELGKRRSLREAIKATKGALHGAVGAYGGPAPRYDRLLDGLRAAYATGDEGEIRRASAEAMRAHASTRERLPIREEFYARTLAGLPPITSVLDVACGLNPLALPWMPLAPGAAYHAYDADLALVGFVGEFLRLAGIEGSAEALDASREVPPRRADLALLLKAIPCLEQLDPHAGRRLLEGLDAPHLLVSFPTRSLGGRGKGMVATYDARFTALTEGTDWRVERWEFATELAFLVAR